MARWLTSIAFLVSNHCMDRINSEGLRVFLTVARIGHLGRASEALHLDQSTVSRKIARLETSLGVPLFDRIGRSIRLTPAGDRFIPPAERLLHSRRDATSDAAAAA